MKLNKQQTQAKYLLILVSLATLVFLLALAIDITPFLRGPVDPILESHWPYYFVNTVSKVWLPLGTFVLFSLIYFYFDKKADKNLIGQEIIFLIFVMFSAFLFQLSLVY